MSRYFTKTVLILSVAGLSACSMFTRRNSASVEEEAKTATPLDMPAKPASETPPASTETSQASPETSPADSGPQVTLVKKDGTVLNADGSPMTTDKPATTEHIPGPDHEATPAAALPEMPKTWTYSGETGPEHWASVHSDYATCQSGKMQSPVDLKWHKPTKAAAFHASYKPTKSFVSDNGHAIQVAFDMGGTIKVKGESYDLMQVQFHSPSEHTLSGQHYPLEAQFVHKSADGKTLVLAALYKEGKENSVLAKIWNAIPNPPAPASATDLEISAHDMMPPMKTYYEYTGSMTTPPCSEGVHWMVFNSPMNVSKGQLEALHHFHADNSRPVQDLNGRKIVNH